MYVDRRHIGNLCALPLNFCESKQTCSINIKSLKNQVTNGGFKTLIFKYYAAFNMY